MFKASPLAKSIIKKNNIDINLINGSGPDGRIIKRDLIDSINNTISRKHIAGYLNAWPTIKHFLSNQNGGKNIEKFMPSYLSGMSGLIYTLIWKNLNINRKNVEQRSYIYKLIIEELEKDKHIKHPYLSNFPNNTNKDKVTRLFFQCMATSNASFIDRVKTFEQEYKNLSSFI